MNRPFHPHSEPGFSPITGSPGDPARAPVVGSPVSHSDPENFIELGFGTGPRCISCRKNVSMCLCNWPEPDVMPVEDMRKVMPELFGLSSWELAERSAFGMTGEKL